MIGVKLTIVLFVITVISRFIIKAAINGMNSKDKILISFGQEPKWYTNVLVFQGVLVFLDFIGVIYSVIWLLFFR